MSYCLLYVQGELIPLPGESDPFLWDVRANTPEDAFLTLSERICAFLRNSVPFIVEGHETIARLKVEVLICD